VRENRMHGLTGGGWKRSDLTMDAAVKRPAGESRGKVAAGPKRQATPPRQPPTLQRS